MKQEVRKQRILGGWRRKFFIGAFICPALLFVLVYAYWPIFSTIKYSFHSWNGFSKEMAWVGSANYQRLFSDPNFYRAITNNLLVIAVSLLLQLPLSFTCAYLIYKVNNKWAEMSKIIYFIPCILSMVMIGLLWRFIYDYQFGVINTMLRALNLPGLTRVWLTDPKTAFSSILVVVIWVYFGYHCVIHSAGLKSLPIDVMEAAKIDGATGWVMIWQVIIPMLSEVLRVSLIISLVGSFQLFDLIWVLTGGGPFHRTDVLATYMYNRAFQAHQFGYASAISIIILLCALGATLAQSLWQRKNATTGGMN